MTSVDVPLLTRISEYFEEFLAGKIGQVLLPDLRSLSNSFSVEVREDPQSCWGMLVEQGVLTRVSRNGPPTDCRFSVDASALLAIVSGQLAPQRAFFQRRVDIGGDIAVGLKTAAIMAKFFQKYPFDIR